MGFFSYICKECDHSILSSYSSDPEINEWMKDAVVLSANGSRVIGEYGGYGDLGGLSAGEGHIGEDAVWLHQACWEVAGKPEYDRYMVVTTTGKMARRHDRKGFNVVTHNAGAEKVILVSRENEQITVNKVAEGWYVSEDGEKFEVIAGSDSAGDQGYFFGKEHDVIDPRVTDEAERARLLAEGIELREKRWYDRRASDVAEWLDPKEREYHDEEKQKEPWRHRFSYSQAYSKQEELLGEWWLRDQFGDDHAAFPTETEDGDLATWKGTEEECKAHLASLWAQFVESDECKAYLARRAEQRKQYQEEALVLLKEKGRYEVSYGPAPDGDSVKDDPDEAHPWKGGRTIFRVEDRLTYETVEKMDGPDRALGVKTFIRDPDYDGNNSAEWEARVEDLRAATGESRQLAEDEARRLNKVWAADGYPVPEDYFG